MKHGIVIVTSALLALMQFACKDASRAPRAYGPLPSKGQLEWHKMEYFSLVCYGLNTYTEEEWAYGDVDTKLFNPSNLDTDQWAKVACEAGMKGLILVAKHHDGFCLWPSRYTDYSVKATPWKNGKGDVLGDLAASCKKYGLKTGVYLSPWDRNHAEYGRKEYVDYYYKQLEELMTQYGDIFEFWIDGANGGTGYYGGANERRNIDRKTYYGYEHIFSTVKKYQPDAVIFSDVGPGSRWVGNEAGIGGKTNWNRISTQGKFPGDPNPEYNKKLKNGDPSGEEWIPAEVNTTLLWPKAWYFHTGHQARSLSNLVELYYSSIGRGSPLNLGLAIAPSGQIRNRDARALLSFRKQMEREFAVNLVEDAEIIADDYRGKQNAFAPDNCIDGNTETYWATNDSVKSATLNIDFGKETSINRLLLQEYISLGQRVCQFTLEAEQNGNYKEIAAGTTIGYKRILRFNNITTSRVRISLKTDAPCLTLSNLGIYHAPRLVADPVCKYDTDGTLSFDAVKGISIFYAIGNRPKENEFKKYNKPVKLASGGELHCYAMDKKENYKTDITKHLLGLRRSRWKVSAVDNKQTKTAAYAIDNNPNTFLLSDKDSLGHPHEIIIDMEENVAIGGFSYLPRQDGVKDGMIYEYEFYVSQDAETWGMPEAEGTFNNIENNPVRQLIRLEKPVEGRYIKLVSKSDVKQSGTASFAEIEVFQ